MSIEPMTPMESLLELAKREGRIPQPLLNGDDPYGLHAAREAWFRSRPRRLFGGCSMFGRTAHDR